MSVLFLFKRFEIWLLLAVAAGLLYVAFSPEESEGKAVAISEEPVLLEKKVEVKLPENPEVEPRESEPLPEEEPALAVREVRVLPDGSGKLVEVTLSGRSLSGKEATVNEETLTASTSSGEPVGRFFEPFREDPTLFSDQASLITTRWWIEGNTDSIWLEFQGQRVEAVLP